MSNGETVADVKPDGNAEVDLVSASGSDPEMDVVQVTRSCANTFGTNTGDGKGTDGSLLLKYVENLS